MIHRRGIVVNLSKKKIIYEKIEKRVLDLFLGGNGIGAHILYEKMRTNNAFSPESWVVCVPGVLNGSTFPMTSKCGFFGLSPLTKAFGESYFGSSLGVFLKSRKYDFISITGRSDSLCYILVDEGVSLVECENLKGVPTSECEKILKAEYNGSCACIGPAGENLVKFAAIVGEGRQAGRTGLGAVLGSKNIKGIVVVPGTVEFEDKEKIRKVRKKCVEGFLEGDGYPAYQGYRSLGTGKAIIHFSEKWGVLPTKNFEKSQFDNASKIDTTAWIDDTKSTGCHGCMIACGKVYKGVSDPEFETLYSLGSNLLCGDIEVIAEANRLCDEYGIDTISMGGVLGYMMSLSKEGIIQEEIPFGDGDTILSLIEKTAFREGIGDTLAEGVKRLSEKYGNTYHAVHVLGLEPPAYDVRGMKGMALSFVTSPRGACHLRSSAYVVELGGTWQQFKTDRFSSHEKGYVAWMENLMALHDILGTCKFTRDFYLPDIMSEMLEAYTGVQKTPEELIKIGERTFNLEWLFNIRNGVRIGNLPPKFGVPIEKGPSKGYFISEEDERKMKREYFKARGWDEEGVPTKKTLGMLKLPSFCPSVQHHSI